MHERKNESEVMRVLLEAKARGCLLHPFEQKQLLETPRFPSLNFLMDVKIKRILNPLSPTPPRQCLEPPCRVMGRAGKDPCGVLGTEAEVSI